jgi:hypothetical protein
MAASLHARFDSDTCSRCKQKLRPGDRVVSVFIVQKIGRNPDAQTPWDKGAFLSDEFELAHASCADAGLEGIIIGAE